MRIDTSSGLHGTLIEYVRLNDESAAIADAIVIVKRDNATFTDAPFSTHRLYESEGTLVAEAGHYDLTLEQAQADLDERSGRSRA